MSDPTVAFVCVSTASYGHFADRLAASALNHVKLPNFSFHILDGVEGRWPTGTITRPRVMLSHWDAIATDFVYAIDADMLVCAPIGTEILAEITATQHPGYVNHHRSTLPYDRNPLSRACVPMNDGERYYCGGFFGGDRESVRDLLEQMAWICEPEAATPRWHDESALNRCLVDSPPTVELSPAYCHPDKDDAYRAMWPEDYPRIIVALDKDAQTRGDRGDQA